MKTILSAILLLTVVMGAQAQNVVTLPGLIPTPLDFGEKVTQKEIGRLLNLLEEKSWSQRTREFTEIAAKIPAGAKYTLYEKYQTSGLWGFLNLYYVGSFIQGDTPTGLILLGGLAMFVGTTIALGSQPSGPNRFIWAGTAAAVVGSTMIYGQIRPWFYANEQNTSLRNLLFAGE